MKRLFSEGEKVGLGVCKLHDKQAICVVMGRMAILYDFARISKNENQNAITLFKPFLEFVFNIAGNVVQKS